MSMIVLALLLAQSGTPAATSERFSILHVPCPASTDTEVVVCGRTPERLPLPGERPPQDRPRQGTGDPMAGRDNAGNGACLVRGCQVGVDMIGMGVAAVRLVGKLVDPNSCCEAGEATDPMALIRDLAGGAKRTFGRRADKANRVPIALDAPPPSVAGRLAP